MTRRRPEECYNDTREDWHEAIFWNAAHFTVFRLHRRKQAGTMPQRETHLHQTFPEAVADAAPDVSALVYAVTETGDSFCVPRQEWDKYRQLWSARMGDA